MGFSLDFWYFLPLLAALPFVYRRVKEKISSAPVTTISLARYRLLAAIMQQRKVASGPAKPPVLVFIVAALAIVAASHPIPSVPAPGHGIAVVVAVQTGNTMNLESSGGKIRLEVAKAATKEILDALGPGDPSAVVLHDSRATFSTPLGLPTSVPVEALNSLVSGSGGNNPSSAVVEATRLLARAPSQMRRIAVLFNDGAGASENPAEALEPVRDLPPVEGYIVALSTDPLDRANLELLAAASGWAIVDLKEWSVSRVVSGPSTVSGESSLPLSGYIALAAFALLALALFREVKR